MRITEILTETIKQRLDPKCWKGKHKEGTKIKGGVRVNNCVPNEGVAEGFDSAAFDRHMDKLRAQKELEKTDPMRAMVNQMHSDDAHAEKLKRKSNSDDERQITDPFHPSQGVNIGEQGVAEGGWDEWEKDYKDRMDKEQSTWSSVFGGPHEKTAPKFDRYPRYDDTTGPMFGDGKKKEQGVSEGETWSKHNNPRAGGMSKKSVKSYRRSHPGSKIQTAVTTKPSKLKKGSKDAARRKSFCARMRGMKKHNTSAKTANDPNSNINKSLRRWHCESIEQLQELVMLAEQKIRNLKK